MLKMQYTIEMVMILMVFDYELVHLPFCPFGLYGTHYLICDKLLVIAYYCRLNLHMVDGVLHHQ